LLDLALTVAAGAFEGEQLLEGECRHGRSKHTVALLTSLALRPYLVPVKNVLVISTNLLTCVASVLLAAAMTTSSEDSNTSLRKAAGSVAAAAALLSTVGVGLVLLKLTIVHIGGVRTEVDTVTVARQRREADTELRDLAEGPLLTTPFVELPSANPQIGGSYLHEANRCSNRQPNRSDTPSEDLDALLAGASGAPVAQPAGQAATSPGGAPFGLEHRAWIGRRTMEG
jgi:hypothetical protein